MIPAAFRAAFEALDHRLDRESVAPVAVALSGGSDSLALLHIAQAWTQAARRPLVALTVDHGLHPDSAAWTQAAGDAARRRGARWLPLAWLGPKPASGLPAAARKARHALLAEAAKAAGAHVLLVGHTADDMSESELIRAETPTHGRLAEWSPSPAWPQGCGVFILRPLLSLFRADLRAWLAAEGVAWLDDPTNTDLRFARSRARVSLTDSTPPLLLSCAAGEVARRNLRRDGMGVAAVAVSERETAAAATPASPGFARSPPPAAQGERKLSEPSPFQAVALGGSRAGLTAYGVLELDLASFPPTERPMDTLAKALLCVSGRSRPPAADALARLLAKLAGHEAFTATLAGARVRADATSVRLTRELGRSPPLSFPLTPGASEVFDGRFELVAQASGWRVAPLAGHAAALPRRERDALQSAPAEARPGLPVLLGPDAEVRLPSPFGAGPADARCLAADRLTAAWGLIGDEQALAQGSERPHARGAARALILS